MYFINYFLNSSVVSLWNKWIIALKKDSSYINMYFLVFCFIMLFLFNNIAFWFIYIPFVDLVLFGSFAIKYGPAWRKEQITSSRWHYLELTFLQYIHRNMSILWHFSPFIDLKLIYLTMSSIYLIGLFLVEKCL